MNNQAPPLDREIRTWIAEHPFATMSNIQCAFRSRFCDADLQQSMCRLRRNGYLKNVGHERGGDVYVERQRTCSSILRTPADYCDFTPDDVIRVMYDGDTYHNVAMRLHAEPRKVNLVMHSLARAGEIVVADECSHKGRLNRWKRSVKA